MKKALLNLLLVVAIAGLGFICVRSILDPIEFSNERSNREKAIIARLIDIRTAQIEYRNNHDGAYTDNFDTLISYIKEAQMPIVMKVGELNDDQLERGLTEGKVLEMIEKAKKTNKWAEVDKDSDSMRMDCPSSVATQPGLQSSTQYLQKDSSQTHWHTFLLARVQNLRWRHVATQQSREQHSGSLRLVHYTRPTWKVSTTKR